MTSLRKWGIRRRGSPLPFSIDSTDPFADKGDWDRIGKGGRIPNNVGIPKDLGGSFSVSAGQGPSDNQQAVGGRLRKFFQLGKQYRPAAGSWT